MVGVDAEVTAAVGVDAEVTAAVGVDAEVTAAVGVDAEDSQLIRSTKGTSSSNNLFMLRV
jgi:hypothetical protein